MKLRTVAGAAFFTALSLLHAVAFAQTCSPSWPAKFPPLNPAGPNGGTPWISSALVFDDDGPGPHPPALYVRGAFNSIGGVAATDIAKWDGARWSALPLSLTGAYNMVAYDAVGNGVPFLYTIGGSIAGGGSDIYRWNGVSWWPAASNSQSLWYYIEMWHGAYSGSPTKLFSVDPDGPGPLPPALYVSQVNQWSGLSDASTYGALFQLQSGAWVQVLSGGDVRDLVAFDDDGPGPDLPTLYAVRNNSSQDYGGSGLPPGYSSHADLVKLVSGSWQAIFSSSAGPGSPQQVGLSALANFDPDGPGPLPARLFLGGTFTMPGSSTPVHLAVVGDEVVPLANDADGDITSLFVLDEDGPGPLIQALYAVGDFTHIGGIAATGIARFDGTAWSALGPGLPPAPVPWYIPTVTTLAVFDDDGVNGPRRPFLFAGGKFTTAGYAPAAGIARWDGLSWLPPGTYVDNPVHALLAADDGSGPALYVGGAFLSSAGLRTVGFSRWDGQQFTQMTTGMSSHVDALALFQNQVVAAGKFTSAGGVAAAHIARWNGQGWAPLGAGLNDNADALATFNDGAGPALFAGGKFTAAGGAPAAHIARWNGQGWAPLGAGVDGEVTALATYAGRLCVGGSFAHAGAFAANRIASWDGSTWHPLGNGPPSTVSALAPHRGVLYAGGTSATDPSVALVSAWNGQSWFTLPPLAGLAGSTTRLTALYSFDEDGTGPGQPVLYASGDFDHSGSTALPRLARWDGLSWSAPAQGLDAPALAFAFAPFGGTAAAPTLYAGGEFMVAGGATSWFLASLAGCPTACEANCDGSAAPPVLNVLDLTCFLQRFSAGDPYANCDSSTAPPTLNVLDFTCFLQKFAAGCP